MKPSKPSDANNDDDIVELLNSDDTQVPGACDDIVLKAAREELQNNPRKVSKGLHPSWTQGLSAAAVLLVGIALIPMINSPDHGIGATDEISADTTESAAGLASAARKSLPVAELSSSVDVERSSEEVRLMDNEPVQLDSDTMSAVASPMVKRYEYRSSEDTWVVEINRLIDSEQLDQARAEFDQFKERYPKHKLINTIAGKLLK